MGEFCYTSSWIWAEYDFKWSKKGGVIFKKDVLAEFFCCLKYLLLPTKNFKKHSKITHRAVERIFKGSGFIFFNKIRKYSAISTSFIIYCIFSWSRITEIYLQNFKRQDKWWPEHSSYKTNSCSYSWRGGHGWTFY